jgi:hypothetical protein
MHTLSKLRFVRSDSQRTLQLTRMKKADWQLLKTPNSETRPLGVKPISARDECINWYDEINTIDWRAIQTALKIWRHNSSPGALSARLIEATFFICLRFSLLLDNLSRRLNLYALSTGVDIWFNLHNEHELSLARPSPYLTEQRQRLTFWKAIASRQLFN